MVHVAVLQTGAVGQGPHRKDCCMSSAAPADYVCRCYPLLRPLPLRCFRASRTRHAFRAGSLASGRPLQRSRGCCLDHSGSRVTAITATYQHQRPSSHRPERPMRPKYRRVGTCTCPLFRTAAPHTPAHPPAYMHPCLRVVGLPYAEPAFATVERAGPHTPAPDTISGSTPRDS